MNYFWSQLKYQFFSFPNSSSLWISNFGGRNPIWVDPNCGHSLGTGQLTRLPHPAGLQAVSDAEGPCPTLRCRAPVAWPRPVTASSSSDRRPAWRGSRYTWVHTQQTFYSYLFHLPSLCLKSFYCPGTKQIKCRLIYVGLSFFYLLFFFFYCFPGLVGLESKHFMTFCSLICTR